jgi:thioesterase domain-containing protein/acyl carrier protein
LIQDLRDTFGAPVINAYGMTEGSHQIASTPLEGCERDGDVGFPIGCEVITRREDGTRAEPNEIEDIWIRGENVTAGYEPADSSVDEGGWLRTGDVGTVDARGRICLLARKKELINKGGEKISPAEVDAALLMVPGVAEAGAFGVPDLRLGEDVAAAVVARSGVAVTPEGIRAALTHQLASFKVPNKIFFVDELPKGPTGKLLRRRLAESLSLPTPELSVSRTQATPLSIEDAVVGLWQEVLQIDRVALEDDFFELGGDSLSAAELVMAVSERFGNEPSLTAFFAAPTVAAMARAINDQGVARGAARALVPFRTGGSQAPLFLVHGATFSVDHYRTFVSHLRPDLPVFGVQEDLFRTPAYVPSDLMKLARHYAEVIQTQQPHGPYRLGGYSSGAVIALEIARALRAVGETVDALALIDAYPLWLWGTWRWWAYRFRTLRRVSVGYRARWLSDAVDTRLRRAREGAAARRGDFGRSIAERVSRLSSNMSRIVRDHRPEPLDVAVTVVVTAEAQSLWGDPYLYWKSVTPNLDAIVVPGTHYHLLEEPHAPAVAAALSGVLSG